MDTKTVFIVEKINCITEDSFISLIFFDEQEARKYANRGGWKSYNDNECVRFEINAYYVYGDDYKI